MKRSFFVLLIFAMVVAGYSNNIQLQNASLTGQVVANKSVQVEFDISWENSWRTPTAVPLNWDAAWVFVKYRLGGGEWHHAKLS